MVAAVVAGALGLWACGGGSPSPQAAPRTTAASTTASTASTAAPPTSTTAAKPAQTLDVTSASWKLPAPVSREVVLTDGQALLVLGGQDAAHNSTAAVMRIDPQTGTTTNLGALNPAVHDAAGARLGDRSLVIAGGTPPARATVQAVGPTGPVQTLGQLPDVRTDHAAAVVGTSIYVFGGAQNEGVPVNSVFSSGDGAAWSVAGTLVEPARYPAVAVARSAVYVFGGVSTAAGTDTTSIQRYDPTTQTTTVVAKLPAPLSHASAVAFGDAIFVVGGFVNDQPSNQILRFDVGTNQVTTAGTLAAPITDAAATVIGSVGYLVGGEGPGRATTAAVVILRPQ